MKLTILSLFFFIFFFINLLQFSRSLALRVYQMAIGTQLHVTAGKIAGDNQSEWLVFENELETL